MKANFRLLVLVILSLLISLYAVKTRYYSGGTAVKRGGKTGHMCTHRSLGQNQSFENDQWCSGMEKKKQAAPAARAESSSPRLSPPSPEAEVEDDEAGDDDRSSPLLLSPPPPRQQQQQQPRPPSPLPSPQIEDPAPHSPTLCEGCVVSKVTLKATIDNSGAAVRPRYRFDNVMLRSDGSLRVFLAPGEAPPDKEVEITTLRMSGVNTHLPTSFMYHADMGEEYFINVNYKPYSDSSVPRCNRWEERPVYLLEVPHQSNIWHMLNDGLMGAYQTLREEGLLPLAEIDDEGNMREYTADLDTRGCPKVIDIGERTAYHPEKCRPRTGLIAAAKCDQGKDTWCTEGLVAVNRSQGPILLLAQGTRPAFPRWRHLFEAVSEDSRKWDDMLGTCFRELYVGKSNLLNFYVNLHTKESEERATSIKLRAQALEAFSKVAFTAERAHQAEIRSLGGKGKAWDGYDDSDLERLRQGIGIEEVKELDTLRKWRRRAIRGLVNSDKMSENDAEELREALKKSARQLDNILPPGKEQTSSRLGAAGRRLPVVTFMWRKELKRCIVNEADLLEYVLRRYDVRVKITTFEEPALQMMELMGSTDVLLGNHGAGWTNALFVKQGAAAMQMMPYGWARPGSNITVRGTSYQAIALARMCKYQKWVSTRPEGAFLRDVDFRRSDYDQSLHPMPEWQWPSGQRPGNIWIYQNTVVNLRDWAPVLDSLMAAAGILASFE